MLSVNDCARIQQLCENQKRRPVNGLFEIDVVKANGTDVGRNSELRRMAG